MQNGGVLSTGLQSFPNKVALQWQSTVKETGWARELGPVMQWKRLRSLKQLTLAGWVIHLPPSWLHSFAYLIILLSGLVEITICELVGSEVIRFSPVSLIICKSGKIIPSFGLRQRGLIKHEKREKKRHTQRGARYGKNFLYSAFRISWGWGGMIRHLWISKSSLFARIWSCPVLNPVRTTCKAVEKPFVGPHVGRRSLVVMLSHDVFEEWKSEISC